MRVLITGATGFIGGAIARALLRQGHELVCAVRDPSRLQWGDAGPGTWRAVALDLSRATEPQAWQPHLSGVDAVINAVGIIREQTGQTFDALHHRVIDGLTTRMASDTPRIRDYLDLVLIARNVERIGDHATNIAEDAVFAASAEDIRHTAPPVRS